MREREKMGEGEERKGSQGQQGVDSRSTPEIWVQSQPRLG